MHDSIVLESNDPVGRSASPTPDVVGSQARFLSCPEEVDELREVEPEEIIAGDHHQIVVDTLVLDESSERADDTELLRLSGRVLSAETGFLGVAGREMLSELVGEPVVGRDVDIVDAVVGF